MTDGFGLALAVEVALGLAVGAAVVPGLVVG
jgi:hypothetical protein